MGIDVVVFVVHGQSHSLSDCIEPYVHHLVTYGYRPEVMVLDSTLDPAERNASRESLLNVHRTHGMGVFFASGRERKRYLSNVDHFPLRIAMSGGVGSLINMGLLATRGRSALFIDADTRLQPSASRLIPEGDPLPPIFRNYKMARELSSSEVSRTGTWGASTSASGGCFYKSRTCALPPFIPHAGWNQVVPWFLMSKYMPSCVPVDLPIAVRTMTAEGGMPSAYTPLFDMIYGLVGPGTLKDAASVLTSHLDEFGLDFSSHLHRYVELLSSWEEAMDCVDLLCGKGVKIGYKP